MEPAEATVARPLAFPLRALRSRIDITGGAYDARWSGFLPPPLRGSGAGAPPTPHAVDPLAAGGDSELAGRVWALSQEAQGCRRVQRAFDIAPDDEARSELALELKGHVHAASRCPHANHVLQKAIQVVPPKALQFIVDEVVSASVHQIARHKYGCRIVQRLVEHCPQQQVRGIIDDVLRHMTEFSAHPYGNYVVQNIFEHSTDEDRTRIARVVRDRLPSFCSDAHASAVVGTVLAAPSPPAARREIAGLLLEQPDLLSVMAYTKCGSLAVKRAVDALEEADRRRVAGVLSAEFDALGASRYGRDVVEYLQAVQSIIKP